MIHGGDAWQQNSLTYVQQTKNNNMKKTTLFVNDKVVIQTEHNLQLLVKNELSGNFLFMDKKGNLYSNNVKGIADDLCKEDFHRNPDAWIQAQGLLIAMLKFGVKEI